MRYVTVTPLLHPAAVLRGRFASEPHQIRYIERVRAQEQPRCDVTRPPRGAVLYPTLDDVSQCYKDARRLGAATIDLETAGPHLLCAGIQPFDLARALDDGEVVVGLTVCLRFRRRGGTRWWRKWDEHRQAVKLLYNLLADEHVAKVFHNGVTYDVPELESWGFVVEGRLLDTMLMMHRCYSEMPRGLQWCATRFLWAPVWKTLVDEEDEGEGKS